MEKEALQVKEIFEETKDSLEKEAEFMVKQGDMSNEILKEASSADLIVMGKRLKKNASGELQSSVFEVIKNLTGR